MVEVPAVHQNYVDPFVLQCDVQFLAPDTDTREARDGSISMLFRTRWYDGEKLRPSVYYCYLTQHVRATGWQEMHGFTSLAGSRCAACHGYLFRAIHSPSLQGEIPLLSACSIYEMYRLIC